jgi:hypothetical protein
MNTKHIFPNNARLRVVQVADYGWTQLRVGDLVTFSAAGRPYLADEGTPCRARYPSGFFADPKLFEVVTSTQERLASTSTHDLGRELARRLSDVTLPAEALKGCTAEAKRESAEAFRAGMNAVWWSSMPGGFDLWNELDNMAIRTETAAIREADTESAPKELAGFVAGCPTGYDTVLGWMVQQGKRPEDMGLAEGVRLARVAKTEGVTALWVETPEALHDICHRVRAYPVSFLRRHLGDVSEDTAKMVAAIREDRMTAVRFGDAA